MQLKNFFARARANLSKKLGVKMTQRSIADRLGYNDALVSGWENEVTAPHISRSKELAEIYQVEESVMHREIAELAGRINARKKKPGLRSKFPAARKRVIAAPV